ncbi:MAG TPA: hypothetical protein PK765_05640 [bacterium]|nr:hypothetical protein [bacterium]
MSLPLSISEFRLQENDVPHSLERGRLVNKIDALIRFLGLLSEQMEVLGKGKRSILSARETSHA